MTVQDFSVAYRAPHIVDLLIPKKVGVDGYRIKGSPQFDGSPAFVTLFTAGIAAGFLDPAVDRRKLSMMPGTNRVRAVFDPDTYAAGQTIDAGLVDAGQFWLTFQPVTAGVDGIDSGPVLILTPDQARGTERIVIQGSAPAAANLAGGLTLTLGRRMTGFTFMNNDATNSVFVAFNKSGQEIEVPADTPRNSSFGGGSSSTLVIRGGGGAVSFSVDFTVAQGTF